jgi:hypothetical protein
MAVIEAISTTYLEADAASVTFSSIPATYEHLQLRFSAACTHTDVVACYFKYNGDTVTGNYSSKRMRGATSTASAGATTGGAPLLFSFGPTLPAASFGVGILDILDYANTNKNTTTVCVRGGNNDSASTPDIVGMNSGLWDNTAAVHTITVTISSGNMARGSEFTLYGLNSA